MVFRKSGNMDLTKLNEKQVEAIKHMEGPCLVLAGAGSGKTSVLTNRIANLIENGVEPGNILAITFTNKAAKEMKERVYNLIGNLAYDIQISTFHSFGLRILKNHYELLGYDKNFVILDSDDTLTVIKKIIKECNLDPKEYNAKFVRNKISGAKNELLYPSAYEKIEYDKDIVRVYDKYVKKLKSNNSIDFDDLLLLPIELFKKNKELLSYYQEKYKYILIDEYQDTNEAQYVLTKLLADKYRNLFVVGDESQSIYSFRNANYKNILNFESHYPDTKTILLEQNYRSTKNILNAANSVIKYNKERKDKNLWCNNEVGDKVKYIRVDDEKEEASYVVSKIKELVKDKVKYEDIAILYRTNAQSRVIEEYMLKNAIPYRVVGSFYFYNRKEIKDLLCYLRLIYNYKDDTSLLRIINVPKRGIGDKTIESISKVANSNNISLYEAISGGKELKFKAIIEEMRIMAANLSLTEIVDMVLDKSGIRKELEDEKTMESEIRLENLEEFKSITKNYEEEVGVVSLEDFLDELTLVSDISEHTDSTDKVTLMTVHAVKGLEFDYVFVVGMEEGIFPHFNAIYDGNRSAIEEERRLCYVAITRAKKDLYLLNAKRRILFGNNQANPPSRFIEEIDNEYLCDMSKQNNVINKASKFVKEKMFNSEDVNFEIGDMISYPKYGEGVVVNVDKSIITVAFPYPYGTVKLMKNHKNIKKI